MRHVGERYEERLYYLSGLIMAGEIFREAVELLRPALETRATAQSAGRILLGTVQGDIHDIGKNMLSMLLTSHGFVVIDLGVDVPPEVFVQRAIAEQPDVVCLSCLISSAFESMRTTVDQLKAHRTAEQVTLPILIGGGMIDEHLVRYIGADHWAVEEIQHGDALGKWAGLADPEFDYMAAFGELQPGVAVPIAVERDGKRVELTITPAAATRR